MAIVERAFRFAAASLSGCGIRLAFSRVLFGAEGVVARWFRGRGAPDPDMPDTGRAMYWGATAPTTDVPCPAGARGSVHGAVWVRRSGIAIHDANSPGDTILLAGISKAQLKANP